MTPDLALSLSFEGIRLLRRTPEGWTPVGEVPLDSRSLGEDLAALRQAGEEDGALSRGTKLFLPKEQVRTLSLDDPLADLAAARAALEGATPYAVNDLVIDHVSDGTRTHVAAVASETLAEAEAFAAEHGFRPVCFAATPAGYPGEAFFGPTTLAPWLLDGEVVARDDAPESPAQSEGVPDQVDGIPATAVQEPEEPALRPVEALSAEVAPTPEIVPASAGDGPPPPEPGTMAAPEDVRPDAPPPAPPPRKPGAPLSANGIPEPVFASRARPLPGQARDDVKGANPQAPVRAAPPIDQPARPPEEAPAAAALSARPALSDPAHQRPAPTSGVSPLRREPPVSGSAARLSPDLSATTAETLAATLQPTRDAARAAPSEPRRRGVPFLGAGRTAAPRVGGKPRRLGLILTVALLVVMVAVAVLAAASDQRLASLFGRNSTPAVAAAPSGSAVEEVSARSDVAAAPVETVAAPPVEAAAAVVAAAIAALPAETAAASVETELLLSAQGVWTEAPTLPAPFETEDGLPPSRVPADPGPVSAPLAGLAAAGAPDQPPTAPQAAPTPRAEQAPLLAVADTAITANAPVAAGASAVLPPPRPATEPTKEAPTWVNAMAEPPGRSPRLRPEEIAPPETLLAAQAPDPEPASTEAAPPPSPTAPDELLAALVPGAEPLSDRAGPLLPGALAFAAPMPSAAPLGAFGGVSLAGLRPSARPEDIAPEAAPPEDELAAWDGPRPDNRPEGLAPEALPSPAVDDALAEALAAEEAPPVEEAPQPPSLENTLAAIVASSPDPLAGATVQAVPRARRPDSRPTNFGRVVATQLDRLARASAPRSNAAQASTAAPPAQNLQPNERAESEPEVASAAAAAPSGPTAASVAQAATVQDAMALRENNLIGVYGQPNARRALVRMGNGSYVRVSVGDSFDGGQITVIGDNALNYVKRGQTYALVIPGG